MSRTRTRDDWGRLVRETWIEWARTQPDPKPSWLVSYDQLEEHDKEADRMIGERVAMAAKDERAEEYASYLRQLHRTDPLPDR